MSFRLKIILGIASVQAVLLFLIALVGLQFLHSSSEQELKKRAYTAVRLFAVTTSEALLATNIASLESSALEMVSDPDIAYARVLNTQGIIAQRGKPEALALPFRSNQEFDDLQGGVYHASEKISIAGVDYGKVEIGLSVEAIHAGLLKAKIEIFIIAGAAVVVVGFLSYWFGLQLARGLTALAAGTLRIQHGELGYQIEVRGTDELAETARNFNRMSLVLDIAEKERQRVQAELAGYHGQLEHLVNARTVELTIANETLKVTLHELDEAHSQMIQSEKMASIGQLAAGIAHEINNPIGFVTANMSSLERYVKQLMLVIEEYQRNSDVLEQFSERVAAIKKVSNDADLDFIRTDIFNLIDQSKDGLQRVKKIVQDMKDFSHVGESEWQLVDIHQGLDSTLNIVINELKYKAKISKAYGDLPPVECLAAELNQVFMNLLVNAGQAMDIFGEIVIATGMGNDEIWVAVSDTGGGIKPENVSKIFDPFFTSKPIGVGTGLGLSVSYNIVKKHGGRIEVQTELGKGSTFRVFIPMKRLRRRLEDQLPRPLGMKRSG